MLKIFSAKHKQKVSLEKLKSQHVVILKNDLAKTEDMLKNNLRQSPKSQ